MKGPDNHHWDSDECDQDGSLECDAAFEKKFDEWEERDWPTWLAANLNLPFSVTREDDEDGAYFSEAIRDHFRLGHEMEVVALDEEDVNEGIMVEVTEKGKIGWVPLGDLAVKSKTDKNYWPVREYAVWFANRLG